MKGIISIENRALFPFKDVSLSLTYAGDKGWRLQSERDGVFDDFGAGQILARDLGEQPRIVREEIDAEAVGAVWKVTEKSGSFVAVSDEAIGFFDEKNTLKALITDVRDAGKDSCVSGVLHEGERVFGTGERFNTLDQRGKRVDIYAIDRWCQTEGNSYVPIPFFITTKCVGIFMNRYEHSVFDLGAEKRDQWTILQQEAPIDLYVFVGDHPQKLLFAYSRITGFAPAPAPWLYGTQVCRYAPDFSTPEGVWNMVRAMDENDFPWDAVILEGWSTYDFKKFDALEELSRELHKRGKKVMLYQACGKVPGNALDQLAMDPSFTVKLGDSDDDRLPETDSYNPADNPTKRSWRYVDITNRHALDWWLGSIWGTLVKEIGIDGAKIDFCEQFPDHLPLRFADGRTESGAHHWYPTLYNILMYRLYSERPEGGMCFSRGGGIGAQRYPFLWAGDQLREYPFLRAQLKAVLSSGLSGIPFMSYDMAGYRPAKDEKENPEKNVFIRGVEMACFSANIQTHGKVLRPYDFDEETKDIYRRYAKLHDDLRPYLVEQGKIAARTALPLMRSLFLYAPNDEKTWDIEDEYMLGNALLVAPVLDAGTKRDIYLPFGTWMDYFSGTVYEGPVTLTDFEVPLDSIPVFQNMQVDMNAKADEK